MSLDYSHFMSHKHNNAPQQRIIFVYATLSDRKIMFWKRAFVVILASTYVSTMIQNFENCTKSRMHRVFLSTFHIYTCTIGRKCFVGFL